MPPPRFVRSKKRFEARRLRHGELPKTRAFELLVSVYGRALEDKRLSAPAASLPPRGAHPAAPSSL